MILRDMYCISCGAVHRDVVLESLSKIKCSLPCKTCDQITTHRAVVNGGTRKRYRFCDWPDPQTQPEFYRGQIKVHRPEAVDGNGNPVLRYNSQTKQAEEPMHDDNRYEEGGDIRAEKLDKIYHETDRRIGKSPIFCDQKKVS